jgi:hypothetical protein
VVDQEFERVRDLKYFPLILTADDVKYWEENENCNSNWRNAGDQDIWEEKQNIRYVNRTAVNDGPSKEGR